MSGSTPRRPRALVVRIDNGGPDAVPPASTVTVVAGGVTYDAPLETGVGPGETGYVWVDRSGVLVAGASPDPAGAQSLGGRALVVVRSPDGVRLLAADLAWREAR